MSAQRMSLVVSGTLMYSPSQCQLGGKSKVHVSSMCAERTSAHVICSKWNAEERQRGVEMKTVV